MPEGNPRLLHEHGEEEIQELLESSHATPLEKVPGRCQSSGATGAPYGGFRTGDNNMAAKTFKSSRRRGLIAITAGIDVHKYQLTVVVLGRIGHDYKPLGEQVFNNDETGRQELCAFLDSFYLDGIIMEKTGRYSDPVKKFIETNRGWKHGVPHITTAQPTTVKRFQDEPHTDPRSAFALAQLGMNDLVSTSFLPSDESTRVRELTRMVERLTCASTQVINMIKDRLSGLGYTLPGFDMTSTWGLALVKLLLVPGIDGCMEKVYSLLESGNVMVPASSKRAILDRKTQYMRYNRLSITPFEMNLLHGQLAQLAMNEAFKSAYMKQLEEVINESPRLKRIVQAVDAIDGFSPYGAAVVAGEVDDMARFSTYQKFLLYAGRAPAPDKSGEFVGKRHMTKRCNEHLKSVFKIAGRVACYQLRKDSDIKRYAVKQLTSHPHQSYVAIANTSAKIARIVYKVLHDEVPYEKLRESAPKGANAGSYQDSHDATTPFMLKEAGKRARRFRNFIKQIIDEITPGEARDLYTRVLGIFDGKS